MPSIIPGYAYDIFISYRQKDNKYDGWVTEFVSNLRKELEATFKEDISIYFDENPHDGLKETYQVQDSLKDKIRCVIFIPILSQTYCDPQSFAWKHELMSFCEFTKSSGEDAKVNVGLSNYMSRILPIRIHSLDPEDIQLFESQTGSTLRSIDFIYESGGVTRPLRAKDDDLTKGRSGILYRDQITKVSQSIKAIINAYKHRGSQPLEVNSSQPARSQRVRPVLYAIPAIIILFLLLYYFIPSFRSTEKPGAKARVAILPFREIGKNENNYVADGVKEVLSKHLQKINQIDIPPSLVATERYRDGKLSFKEIADQLDANYLIDGAALKSNDSIEIFIRLIDPHLDVVVWKTEVKQSFSKIFEIQSRIAGDLAAALQVTISPDETKAIARPPTTSIEAYDHFLQGLQYENMWMKSRDNRFKLLGREQFKKSLQYDPEFAEAYFHLAFIVAIIASRQSGDSVLMLTNKALALRPDYSDALSFKAELMFFGMRDTVSTLSLVERAIQSDPKNPNPLMYRGFLHHYWLGRNQEVLGLQNYLAAYQLDPLYGFEGRDNALMNIAIFYQYIGDYNKSIYLMKTVHRLAPDNTEYLNFLGNMYVDSRQFKKLYEVAEKLKASMVSFPNNYDYLYWLAIANFYDGNQKDALSFMEQYRAKPGYTESVFNNRDRQIDYALLLKKNGVKKEYESICNEVIRDAQLQQDTIRLADPTAPKYFRLARAYSLMGDRAKAIEAVSRIKFHPLYFGMHEFISVDAAMEDIRTDERFVKIIEKERARLKVIRDRVNKLEKEGFLDTSELFKENL